MAFNLADLVEHTVDAVPDRTALDLRRPAGDLRRAGGAGQPAGPPPRRAGHRRARPRRHLLVQQPRVRRGDAGRLQAAGRPDQRQLPLRRGRARLPLRQRRRGGGGLPGASSRRASRRSKDRLPLLRHLVEIDDGSRHRRTTPARSTTRRRCAAASPERDFGPRDAGDLYILYTGGTTGLPEGRDVAPRGRVAHARRRHRLRDRRAHRGRVPAVAPGQAGEPAARRPRARAAHARRRAVGHPRRAVQGRHERAPAAVRPAPRVGGRRRRTASPPSRSPATRWPARSSTRSASTTYDTSSLFAISSTAAVFSPVVKDELLRAAAQPVHQRGGRFVRERLQRHAPGREGRDRQRRRAHQRHHRPGHDRHRRATTSRCSPARSGAWPAAATCPSATTRTRSRRPRRSSRSTASATRCPATSPGSSSTAP